MKRTSLLTLWMAMIFILPGSMMAGEEAASIPQEIVLSSPDTTGGMPLHQALSQRHSVRSFTEQELTLAQISQILWAANGITRPEIGKRTAPSPMATFPARIYLANKKGVYLFDPKGLKLTLFLEGDQRSRLSTQKSVLTAPISLIAVSDMEKTKRTLEERWKGIPESEKWATFFCVAEGGGISENIYLEVTSLGLGTVFVGGFKKDEITELLKLKSEVILWVMPIGYEKPAQ
jgi:nitroreductase